MQPSSKLNLSITPDQIKSTTIYSLSGRFYAINFILLAILGLAFLLWSRHENLDIAISRMWFDAQTARFPWQHNRWLDLVNHRLVKDVIIAGAILLLLRGIQRRHGRYVLVALLFGLGPLVVGVLKAHSAHSCPWDLAMFGGKAESFVLLDSVPANSGPGQCFPGGHASSGFSLMALFFLWWPERPRRALVALLVGITVGLLMGYGQVMRGAHFFSHNLWAGWWVWLTQVVVFAGFSFCLNQLRTRNHHGSA
ncbi:phosphatase PAP2 family protein [Pantoea sp. Mb-10]|uniref:phosphatase PAP2 family protein n=1 Tax=unclassified Pantoea TaxID=2630326 RepID=UPI001E43F236|nr:MULTISPECIES: phosphatase PAP2 family protein [unclassified Pantoea]MCE0488662.1 phosphatase PAP2 family protein [Pantoea sp. Mb-10]MCE0500409.1 phosphatase PAP2 family protein [Pantoea sp. Pb-8]